MSKINNFSSSTIEALKYYVYALIDPITKKVCYIGKGQGQRVFQSLEFRSQELKKTLTGYIVRHDLTEEEAFLVEGTLIDLLPYFSFSDLPANFQNGKGNQETGIDSIEDIENKYAAPIIMETDFQHNVLVISINRSLDFHDTLLTPVKLYESTRKAWHLNKDRVEQEIEYVIAKYHGVLKEIYKPERWYQYPTEDQSKRFAFEGDLVSDPQIRELYLGKKLDKRSFGSPLTYIVKKS